MNMRTSATFLNVPEPFQIMSDGRVQSISTVKPRVHLDFLNTCPIHSASYRAGPTARDFERSEVNNMLAIKVIQPAQTEWEPPVVFVSKKDGTLCSWVDY